jgi:hypothetical protein
MTLEQFQDLKVWHLRHHRDAPVEAMAWNSVMTLWLCGWVGAPVAFILSAPVAAIAAIALAFLPSGYVALRRRLARRHQVRCDWLVTLR